ncbi:MAG: ATP-binding protein [Firmicutes bacterium]|nr:ATP-binding protein [Bacillota bacterium]
MNASPSNPFKPGAPAQGSSNPYKPGSPNPFKPGGPAQPQPPPSGQEVLANLVQAQRTLSQQTQELNDLRLRLAKRTHQMAVLQHVAEILAATPKVNQVASVLQDAFVREFGAKACVVWTLEDQGGAFQPKAGYGLPRSQWAEMVLPAPNPFPTSPIVLFQSQWLEPSIVEGPLEALRISPELSLYFLPFEHQLLLMGFAILALETGRNMEEEQDTFTVLQRQVAVSIYNAWLFRDLGQQRDALRRQTGELETANTALREADRFKSEFLALTSHELRTPLTGILGFTRLVLDELYEDEEERRRMLEDSYTSGKHLLSLLNDILDLAKIESGRMQVVLSHVNLQTLIDEVKPIATAYPRSEKVELVWPDPHPDLPEVMADPGRLKQVLLNLLSNALKFTREGSVRMEVERGFGAITLRVVDTGIGIKTEDQARLFQKFVQADGGHARQYGGTGLGLVICKHLMEMMGGTISLFSEGAGQGSTLTITMPIV